MVAARMFLQAEGEGSHEVQVDQHEALVGVDKDYYKEKQVDYYMAILLMCFRYGSSRSGGGNDYQECQSHII